MPSAPTMEELKSKPSYKEIKMRPLVQKETKEIGMVEEKGGYM